MATNVVMPQLGESVTEGTVTRWLKNVGDAIKVDEAIVEVSTDKVDTEIPSPVAGVLLEIKAAQDAVIPVGGVMAIIGESGSVAPSAPGVSAPVVSAPVVQTPPPAPKPEPVIEKPVVQAPAPTPVAQPVAAPAASGSTVNVLLPQLGESVTEGTITRWLKNVGDKVSIDEAIVEISTDKVDTEIPSPSAGVISEIRVVQDQVAPVGAILAVISTSASAAVSAPAPVAPVVSTPAPVVAPPVVAPPVATPQVANTPAPVVFNNSQTAANDSFTTPIVRKLAKEQGVDLSQIKGTGVNGRVRKDDVLNVAKSNGAPNTQSPSPVATTPPPVANTSAPVAQESVLGKVEQTSRLRRVIAERMVKSLHISAQLTSVIEVDVTKISGLRNKVKDSFVAREGVKLSYLPFYAIASIESLNQFPTSID